YLLDARAEIERVIASLRASSDVDRVDQERAARKAVERRVDEHGTALSALDVPAPIVAAGTGATTIAAGDLVELDTLGGKVGRVVEFRETDAVVAIGAVKMTVPRSSLRATTRTAERATSSVAFGDLPDLEARTEVDLRGVRVMEVDELLLASLDAA